MNRHYKIIPILALGFVTGQCIASEQELLHRIMQQDGWVAYQVPMTADAGELCCFQYHGQDTVRTGCELDGNTWSIGKSDSPTRVKDDVLKIYLRVSHASVEKVRTFGASCAVHEGAPVRWLDKVDAAESVAMLADAAAKSAPTSHEIADAEIAALALHAEPSATPALAQLADSTHPHKLREQALFWLGQLRGAPGAQIVEHVATTDGDADLRANAVFDLSQAHAVDGYAAIYRIAQSDPSDHVREQALFWMAQMGDTRAKDDIVKAIEHDTSHHVREQGVFALSQLKHEQADAALIGLVRGNYPREVKQQALFWLGQSGSNDALKFLDEVLDKQPTKTTRS
jgi:HEAT repeats